MSFRKKVYEGKKNFAGKVNEIAKVIVRIVTSEGLQLQKPLHSWERLNSGDWKKKTPIETGKSQSS